MELSLPAQKIKKIRAESRQILEAELVTARTLSRLIGKMNATNQVIPPAPVLQEPTNGPDNGSKESRPGLRDTSQSIPRQSGGTDLVGHPNDKMEWQDSISNGARPDHRIRCFFPRLGSILPRHQHRGTLVSSGGKVAHQLPRTASSDSSTKNLYEEHEGTISIVEDRQHNSSCLHQQPRGNYIQGFDSSNQRFVDVVSRKEHSHISTIPTWSNEPGGRHGIKIHEGSIRLESGSFRFSENQQEVWSSGSGPVCNQINQPVPSLLQLAARSICRSNRCLSPGLDNSERFRQPTLEPSTESASKNTESRGRSNSGSPSMEISAMVSPPTVITSRLAMPTTQAGHGNRVSPNNAPTSRVEHLRERLDEQGLSSQATDLILNSWRTKTNKSYDSLFGRWNRWCTERSSNPFSGPVSEVANFLATLYQEGYQYNSVNAYRSAISSVHEKVDGVPVGQHPIITRLVKGVFNVRPPIPRYSSTWDVQKVLNYLDSQGKQTPISLKALTLKTAFLLAITRPSRSADLSQLNITRIRRGANGISFLPSALAKQSRQGKPIESFYFPAFLANTTLCPVRTLDKYLDKTKQLRENENRLFISFIKPHKAVTSSSIARWLRTILEEAGIDSSIFVT